MRLDLFNTTAFRLSVGYTLLVTLAVSVTLGSAYLLTESLITDEVDLIIDTELKSLEEKFARSGLPGVTDEINLRIDSWGRIGAVYMLADSSFERFPATSPTGPSTACPPRRGRSSRSPPSSRAARGAPGAGRGAHAAGRGPAAGRHRHLAGTAFRREVPPRHARRHRAVDAGGGAGRFWFSYRLARRVGEVTRTCQRIMAGEPGRRLPVAGANDEFDALAVSVNRVLDRLEEQARTLRANFDSTAHDLRAPLHRLRTRMDALLRAPALAPAVHESIEAALREVDHLQRTLGTLLQIAFAESGAALASPAAVDVGELAAELVELFEPVAAAHGLSLDVRARPCRGAGQPPAARTAAHRSDREQPQVRARRWAHQRRRAGARRGRAAHCERQWSGIDAADRARAAQPFVRFGGGGTQEGSGLGLSLVAAIARLHRGRIELQGNDPGLRVVFELSG